MSSFSVEDPVMWRLGSALSSIANKSYMGGRKSVHSSVHELLDFKSGYRNAPTAYSLGYIIDNFSSFAKSFQDCLYVLGQFVVEESMPEDFTAAATREEADFYVDILAQLKIQVPALTATHVELQAHFFSLVVSSSKSTWAGLGKVKEFFSPLSQLRDAYFHSPSQELLTEYLELSRKLMLDEYFTYSILAGITHEEQAENILAIEKHEAALEVMILMEALNNASPMKVVA